MSKRGASRARRIEKQGADLIELVIARVRANPAAIAGFCGDSPLPTPQPLSAETLAGLTEEGL